MPDPYASRDRAWLQTFLHLDALASPGNIPKMDIARQEDTVLRALTMLDQGPGVMLADGVGMGKTFEALGVLAAREQLRPGSRFLVLTPGPDLNRKWYDELERFTRDQRVFAGFSPDQYEAVTRLGPFLAAAARRRLVIAPVTMFLKQPEADRAFLLGAFCQWKGLHGATRTSLFRDVGFGLSARELQEARFLEQYRYDDLEPHLDRAFRGGDDGEPDLAALHESDPDRFVKQAKDLLVVVRFRLVRVLLPDFDLLVLDEAHKLKNADTVRAQGISVALRRKFDRALFLTATPFQLGVHELRQIFTLFGLAAAAPPGLAVESDALLTDVHAYQVAYAAFEGDWRRLDDVATAAFSAHLADDPDLVRAPAEPALRPVAAHLRRLFELKQDRIEPAFRRWMIRSVRNDLTYRDPRPVRLKAEGPAALPFLAYERMIDEIFRQGDRTHKAAVEINMVSSYGAARVSQVLVADPTTHPQVEQYRGLLERVLGNISDDRDAHPKLRHVLQDALDAAERDGEKTLIFCTRTETLRELQRELKRAWDERLLLRWQRAYPEASFADIFGTRDEDEQQRGRHAQLQQRFHRMQDLLSLALRERYLQTLLEFGDWGERHLDAIVARAQDYLSRVRTKPGAAERVHFGLLKRVVEVAAVELRVAAEPAWAERFAGPIGTIRDPRYIDLGYDLDPDDLEDAVRGSDMPKWHVGKEHVRVVVSARPHLWSYFTSDLYSLPDLRRVRVVERLAHYLTHRALPFLAELMTSAAAAGVDVHEVESARLLEHVDAFWGTPIGLRIVRRLKDFLLYFHDLSEKWQRELLAKDLLKGYFVRQTSEAETRDNLREVFNTPLHPMVLIANEVMQEGLDLHRACRRVVHHDLPWNPAQLEQRVGRVDRIGSRIRQLLSRDKNAKLTVLFPLIHQTIDTRIHGVVRAREKWLEFLLGARPEVDPEAFDAVPPPPLPDGIVQRLRIDLSPAASTRAAVP
jgi:superfamily II DNA or RNA helicase